MLEYAIGSDNFGIILNSYDIFKNDDEEAIKNGDANEEEYQGLTGYPELNDAIYNSNEEKASNSYNQYIRDEVALHD